MKIEIWSDIACPFCYIGKRKLEAALAQFAGRKGVELVWRSFQLDPSTRSNPGVALADELMAKKGWNREQTEGMMSQVNRMAAAEGLDFHMDKTIIANTLDAHRMLHGAARFGLQDALKEALFRAYFTDGEDIADEQTLVRIAVSAGMPEAAARQALVDDACRSGVEADMLQAQAYGIQGVPFFIFNGKYVVSGAQPSLVFSNVLAQTASELTEPAAAPGATCDVDGNC